jgi:outer membrane protein assembly factor BamA/autotransporter translocation and assembly factor TamB
VLGACAGLVAVLAHTPPVRAIVLSQLMSRVSAGTGFVLSAAGLDYNLFRLTATAYDVQVNRPGSEAAPVFRARRVALGLNRRTLSGSPEVDWIDAEGLSLVIDVTAAAEPGPAKPFHVPGFTVGRATLRHADIEVVDPGGLGHLKVRDAALDATGGTLRRLEGPLTVYGGLSLDNEDMRVRIDRIEGRAFLDGDSIGVRSLSIAAGRHRIGLDGSVTITGPSPAFDLGLSGDLSVGLLADWFPALPRGDGLVQLTGRVTGPLDDPRFTYAASTAGLTVPDVRVPASSVEGYISRTGIYVEQMHAAVGQGRVEASGRLHLGPGDLVSRLSLQWADVSMASLAQVFPLLPIGPAGMVATGSARLNWPGTAVEFTTLSGDITSRLRVDPELEAARIDVAFSPGSWRFRGTQALAQGGTVADLDATITINAAAVANSAVLGTLTISSANLLPAAVDVKRAFPALPDIAAWIADTPLTLDGTVEGTLGAPRLSGTAASSRMRIGGLPVLRASAAFEATASSVMVSKATAQDDAGNAIDAHAAIDIGAGSSHGGFSARIVNPDPFVAALAGIGAETVEASKATGSVVAAGTWEGPLDDPILAVRVTARDVAIARAGFSVEGMTAEGRVTGPLSNPEAMVHVSAGSLRAPSTTPMPADVTLTLSSGRLEMTARAPVWSATVDGQIATEAPHGFSARLSIADLDAAWVQALTGAWETGYVPDGKFSATIDAAGSVGSRTLRVGGQATLAGGSLSVGGSRLIDGVDASIETRDGRLWLTRFAGRGFGGPLSASGDLPLNWVAEYLPEGWRLDQAPAASKLAAFTLRAEPDVMTLGTWLRPEEPGRITGGLALRVTGTASALTAEATDARLVIEPGTVTIRDVPFTLARAATVAIEGGQATIERFTLTAPAAAASASGTVGLTGERPLEATVSVSGAMGFLRSLLPGRLAGRVEATFTATGTAAAPRLNGRLSLEDAEWDWPEHRVALRDWSGVVTLTPGAVTLERLSGQVNNGEADLSGALTYEGGVGAGLTVTSGGLAINARAPDWSTTLDGQIAAAAPHDFSARLSIAGLPATRVQAITGAGETDYLPDGTISARIDAAGNVGSRTLRVGGQATLSAASLSIAGSRVIDGVDAAVETRDGRLWLTRFAGRGFGGPLSASGDLPLNWFAEYLPAGWRLDQAPAAPEPAAFTLRAAPDLQTLGTWLRPEEPRRITGGLALRVSGTATALAVEALDAQLVIEPGTVTIREVPFTLAREAKVAIARGRATIDRVTITAPAATASAAGIVGLTGERPLDATVSVAGALGFLTSMVPGRVAGRVEADFTATGTAAAPRLNGRLSLDDAAWVWPEQRMAFRDWTGEAVATADAVTIEKLTGRVNGGEADVTGTVTLGGTGTAGLTLRVRDAFMEVVRGFRSQADADLTLASARDGARISGTITVTSGAYREPITAMARLFSAPRKAPAAAAGNSTLRGAVSLDVGLTASSPIVIENSAARLDLVPSLRFQGSLEEPVLLGTLDMVDEGRLSLLGRSFRLTEGRLTFPRTGDPTARLIGETRVGDYAVTMRAQGPMTNLEASYTSDPPLSQRDVQSLLVTGRTTDTGGTRSDDAEEFVLGTASSDLLGLAGQLVGLDSVQLGRGDFELGSSDVNPAMRLTVSKSISARSRLILSQDLDNNKLTWIVALTPRHGYEVRLSQRDNVEEVVEFRQELLLGPGVSPPRASGARRRASGPRVRSLEFTGALGFPVSELESVVRLRPTRAFDAGAWQEDRARLEAFYRDRGHAVARIAPQRTVVKEGAAERVLLTYRVDPGPRTVLNASGIDLSDNDRRALMLVWSRSVLPEFLSDDMTRYLRGLLARRGYLRPSITVTLDEPGPDVVAAYVAVAPGPATSTRRLAIEGNRAVAEPELRAALSGNPALDEAWVDPAPLVAAVAAIYAERGFPSARVSADELVFDGPAAERRLRVIEGPQAVVNDIVLTGVPDARTADAKTAIALQAGQPLLPGTEAEARRRLRRFYLDRGFRSAAVRSASKSDPDGRVAMTFLVTEGPVSMVDAVAVTGLEATRPSAANRAITLRPGEPAGQPAVSDTQLRLYGLGVFRSADIGVEPAPGAPAEADAAVVPVIATVALEEARRFQLRYGIQLSNQYGPVLDDFTSAIGVAADIRDRNFLGRAFTLGASGRLEKNLQSLRGQFSLPPLLNQRLQTNYFVTFRSETDTSEGTVTYTDNERDATFEQRLRLPRQMEVSWGYSYNVRDVTFDVRPRGETARLKGALGTLNGTFILDARDKPFDASRGWFQSSNLQWGVQALGSDLDYVRVLLRQFYYRPAGPFIFASGVRWGWLHGIGGEVPVTILDRFFDAGGAQTVRGYAEDSLSGFEVLGAPVGGTKLLILNQEARFPLFSKWFQGAIFIDAGNTFAPGKPLKLDQLAVGTGFGIRIMTPFAPIRIDVGYPLNRRPEDRPYRVYFSIGQIF